MTNEKVSRLKRVAVRDLFPLAIKPEEAIYFGTQISALFCS